MKKLILAFSITLFTLSSCSNNEPKGDNEPKETTVIAPETAELKDHVCTDACHTEGHCVFVHGEKGHVCDETCKVKEESNM